MQRSFITEMPEELNSNQVVVDLPRYEHALAKALLRRDLNNSDKFLSDAEPLQIVTTINQIKMFVDALSLLDKDMDSQTAIPYTNYVGLQFLTTLDAVSWARRFVQRFFPTTEERLLKRQLLTIPLDKTEIVWIGGDKYLTFVQAVATAPSTDELVKANAPSAPSVPQLSMEDVKAKRAEIASRQAAKDALKAANKGGKKGNEAQTASTDVSVT